MSDDAMDLRRQSEEKIDKHEYDVFVSYNRKDREAVKEIYDLLKDNGVAPWRDEWDLRPGFPWQPEAEQEIRRSDAVAVFIGKAGWGPCQKKEIELALEQHKQRQLPVIPVLLPGAEADQLLSLLLQNNTWADFRHGDPFGKSDPDPLERLLFGITGKHVKPLRPFVLIATLGESPAIVPAMYDLLTKREQLTIGKVSVLYPQEPEGDDFRAYKLVTEALKELADVGRLEDCSLPFADANSWKNTCRFLRDLFRLLETYQNAGERVCLSLAGGRKSMAALMAWVAPFFPCVKKLYHVLDPDEDHFPSLEEVESMSRMRRKQALRPNVERLKLVDIPFGRGQHINKALRAQLFSASANKLARYGEQFVHDLTRKDGGTPPIPDAQGEGGESVLIVPLGKFPMVATQLYTLLTKQKGRKIREVVLVYPQYATGIVNAAEIVREALREEAGIPCTFVPVPGLKDIDTSDACMRYQEQLEVAIDQVRAAHPECSVDLALSGGRKGMTAMTIFAAQKKCIFSVYHTLITDEDVNKCVDRETDVKALRKPGLSKEERNARLFLRAYDEEPYNKFLLFPVPIFPAEDQV